MVRDRARDLRRGRVAANDTVGEAGAASGRTRRFRRRRPGGRRLAAARAALLDEHVAARIAAEAGLAGAVGLLYRRADIEGLSRARVREWRGALRRCHAVKALLVLCLLGSLAHAGGTEALDPVASDFCTSCRRLASTPIAGVGSAVVYVQDHPEGGTTYWLAVVTKAQTFASGVFDIYPGGCGAGHCTSFDDVVPSLRTFTYRADKVRVTDVGLALAIDRTDELLETEPPRSATSKQWLFVVCGDDGATWTCRATESRCARAAWARSKAPAVVTTCTEPLGRSESL